jgi:hypothetical protein
MTSATLWIRGSGSYIPGQRLFHTRARHPSLRSWRSSSNFTQTRSPSPSGPRKTLPSAIRRRSWRCETASRVYEVTRADRVDMRAYPVCWVRSVPGGYCYFRRVLTAAWGVQVLSRSTFVTSPSRSCSWRSLSAPTRLVSSWLRSSRMRAQASASSHPRSVK